jgi:hypothetical protein
VSRARVVVAAGAALLVGVAACVSDASVPKIGPPSRVTVATSPSATGMVRTSIGSFTVKVADANGNAVPGVTVNFFASGGGGINFAPASAASDASGVAATTVTLGTRTGSVELTAYATGVEAPAVAVVSATPGPLVSLVTTPKSLRFVSVGDTARITYLLQDEYANAVTGASLAVGIPDPTLVSVDPQGLVRALRAGGRTTISISAGGRTDTVAVSVLAVDATPCTELAAPTNAAVGSVVTVQGPHICLPGAAAAASEYTVVVHNSSTDGSSGLFATINSFGAGVAPTTALAPTSAPSLARAAWGVSAASKTPDERFHRRILTEGRRLKRLIGTARAARAARSRTRPATEGGLTPSVSFNTIPVDVAAGALVSLNVSEFACDRAVLRGFRVAHVSQKAIILADTLNPSNGFTDADYQRFGQRFDDLVHPLDVDNFGAPSDLDGNGKVAILFTKYVNELTPANSGSFIGGFFHPRDLFPKTEANGLQACAGSNEGEMFYMLVPDPTGVVNGNRYTLGFVDTLTTGVLAHEFQHLINAGRRIYVNTTAEEFEENWLNEGLSHIAEELLYYRESGMQPRQRLTDALIRTNATKYAFWRANASSNFSRLLEYIEEPEAASPIDAVNDELSTRGAAWSFLRYAVDRAFTTDENVWKRFTNSARTGLATVNEGLQTDARPYLADFALANYLSDLGITEDPRFVHKSWNYRDIFSQTFGSRTDGVFTPLGYYPIKLSALSDAAQGSVYVRGGSASYHRVAVPAGREALLTFGSGQGAAHPLLVFSVVRTK